MLGYFPTIILSLLVLQSATLHLQDSTQAQIDALKAQQANFETNVNKLITNITAIEKAINSTTDRDQKIMILENAITSERETVFELSKIIIPPFNISKNGCQKMTDQQKVELLDQLAEARRQVLELKNISATMPKCDDVDTIKRDIEKQLFFLNSIQSIIYTNCSMNVILSPTIFQTNIYAGNWSLGNMTIDDLIEQYYQRSIRYDNITNCPIDFPFFDGKQCIQCNPPTPVFDISQKKCFACPPETHIDNAQKKCVPDKHYTNFSTVSNWAPESGPFPTPDPDATPCPSTAPYYNGTFCIQCPMPKYFDIPSQSCQYCPNGTVFGLNEKACVTSLKNMLTKLSGTRWVTPTNNFTNVLKERAAILDENKTSGMYRECPAETPYYDGITCISCPNQFDLNTLKCTTAPNNTQFDNNVHIYIPPKVGETAPNAPNLIGTPQPDNPNIVNCNSTHPYYDGVACIACPEPFVYFELATKTCVVCDPKDIYNATTRTCTPRPVIYISTNENRLLATPARSIDDYHNNITKTIANNPNAIVVNCDQVTDYSNYQQCFPCASNEYFNVETFKCVQCVRPNVINPTNNLCEAPSSTFTNLNAPNIVNLADPAKEQANINEMLKQNNESKVCDISTPYYNGTKCITCPPPNIFFDYVAKTCIGCPPNSYLSNGKCLQSPIVSNVPALAAANNYLETPPNATLNNLNQTIQSYAANGIPYRECPANAPLYNATTKSCQPACPVGSYLDLATGKCVICPNFDQASHTCTPPVPHYPNLNNTNWTSSSPPAVVAWREKLMQVNGSEICPITAPYYNNVTCVSCPAGQVFNYDTLRCYSCSPLVFDQNIYGCLAQAPNNTVQTNINSPNLIYGGTPKAQWQQYYDRNATLGAKDCPPETPFFDGINCIKCFDGYYFNLETRTCMHCPPGSVYTTTTSWKGCVDSSGNQINIDPDIAKMYANIF